MNGRLKEKKGFCYLWAALVVAASTIPTAAGYLYAPEGSIFTGNARFTLDYNTYLSFIFQANEGHLLFQEMYWPWPNPPLLFQPLFLLLGLFSRFTGMTITAAHEMGRIAFGLILLAVIYRLISLVFKDGFERSAAFILVSFGGGLAWAYPWLNPGGITIEQHFLTGWVEANTFLSILAFPLFSSSLVLMVSTCILLLRLLEKGGLKRCVLLGISAGLLSLNHPYDTVIIFCVCTAFLTLCFFLMRDRFGTARIFQGFISICVSLSAAAAYLYTASRANPAFSYWSRNMFDPSPPFAWVAANFGFIAPMAVIGIFGALAARKRNPGLILLSVWGVVGSLIIYLPFNFQRRLIEGLHIPLSLLAAHGIFWLASSRKKLRTRFAVLFILLCLPANIMTIAWSVRQLKENNGRLSPYITRDENDALDWLKTHTGRDAAVLAGYRMSNNIPAFSGNHVFWGRWVNEAVFAGRHALVRDFFSSSTADSHRLFFAAENNIRYLFWEKDVARETSFNPYASTFLDPVYRNGEVTVFKVAAP
ncbi:MAG: hypothetical protein P9M00_02915 [Candidatus Tritonobacter lacicola]|nr:hypothetical protein [Candidatus Tritonobacter lacicola]